MKSVHRLLDSVRVDCRHGSDRPPNFAAAISLNSALLDVVFLHSTQFLLETDVNTKWNGFVFTMITICVHNITTNDAVGPGVPNAFAAGGIAGNSVAVVAGSGSPGEDEPHLLVGCYYFQIQVRE